jgi:hypothetical protein
MKLFKTYIFIQTKYIYTVELDGYIKNDNLRISFTHVKENTTTYGRRFSVHGILIPFPSILVRLVTKKFPKEELVYLGLNRVFHKSLNRKRVSFYIV